MPPYVLTFHDVEHGWQRITLDGQHPYLIGRAPDSHIRMPTGDHRISRRHAVLKLTAEGVVVHDLGSRNGTFANGARITTVLLYPGEHLRLGRTILILLVSGDSHPLLRDILPVPGTRHVARRCSSCQAALTSLLVTDTRPSARWLCAACSAAREQRGPLGASAPREVGDFRLLRVAASGPRTEVFEAVHLYTKAHAAVKWIHVPLPGRLAQRFIQEQQLALSLVHPRIVRCLAVGLVRGTRDPYIALEWMPDGDAATLPATGLDPSAALHLGADLFEALGYLHTLGLWHRDIKPANLLLFRDAEQRLVGKLADFGVTQGPPGAHGLPEELVDPPHFTAPGSAPPTGPLDAARAADLHAAAETLRWLLRGADLPSAFWLWLRDAFTANPPEGCTMSCTALSNGLRRLAQGASGVGG